MLYFELRNLLNGVRQWYAAMVAIPKKNGKLCICVDSKHLNKAVLRESAPTTQSG